MNPIPHNWKEARRLQAWHLKQQGWPQRQIAEALGVSAAAVSQWVKRARMGGPQALRHQPPPGAPCRLAPDQLARLPDLLHRGPEAYGFRGQVWTRQRVAEPEFAAARYIDPQVKQNQQDTRGLLDACIYGKRGAYT
jgi:transposase